MFQNIKVDIVYYKTNTDFEMEFNLCGCCRMRLLTDKASDKKTLVHDLARAVSRSRVIIIAGKLSGEEGIIEITARAIAKTVTEIDKSLYGIRSAEKVNVINGATPLVTPNGDFGGCIIESGPQSMILLSDDRAVRKTVMNTLIHPYIEEICALDLKAKANKAAHEVSDVITSPKPQAVNIPETIDASLNTEAYADEAEPDASDTVIEPETQAEAEPFEEEISAEDTADSATDDNEDDNVLIEETDEQNQDDKAEEPSAMPLSSFSSNHDGVILEGGMIFETDDHRSAEPLHGQDDSELFIEHEQIKKRKIGHYNYSYVREPNEDSQYHTPDDSEGKLKSGFSGNLAILIISVLLLIVLAVLCYCIFYVPSKDGVTASAYLRETFNTLFG